MTSLRQATKKRRVSDDDILKLDPLDKIYDDISSDSNRSPFNFNKRATFTDDRLKKMRIRLDEHETTIIEKDLMVRQAELMCLTRDEEIKAMKLKHEQELIQMRIKYDRELQDEVDHYRQKIKNIVYDHECEMKEITKTLSEQKDENLSLKIQLQEVRSEVETTKAILRTVNDRNIVLVAKNKELACIDEDRKRRMCDKTTQIDDNDNRDPRLNAKKVQIDLSALIDSSSSMFEKYHGSISTNYDDFGRNSFGSDEKIDDKCKIIEKSETSNRLTQNYSKIEPVNNKVDENLTNYRKVEPFDHESAIHKHKINIIDTESLLNSISESIAQKTNEDFINESVEDDEFKQKSLFDDKNETFKHQSTSIDENSSFKTEISPIELFDAKNILNSSFESNKNDDKNDNNNKIEDKSRRCDRKLSNFERDSSFDRKSIESSSSHRRSESGDYMNRSNSRGSSFDSKYVGNSSSHRRNDPRVGKNSRDSSFDSKYSRDDRNDSFEDRDYKKSSNNAKNSSFYNKYDRNVRDNSPFTRRNFNNRQFNDNSHSRYKNDDNQSTFKRWNNENSFFYRRNDRFNRNSFNHRNYNNYKRWDSHPSNNHRSLPSPWEQQEQIKIEKEEEKSFEREISPKIVQNPPKKPMPKRRMSMFHAQPIKRERRPSLDEKTTNHVRKDSIGSLESAESHQSSSSTVTQEYLNSVIANMKQNPLLDVLSSISSESNVKMPRSSRELLKLSYINAVKSQLSEENSFSIDGKKSDDYVMVDYIESPDEVPSKTIESEFAEEKSSRDEKKFQQNLKNYENFQHKLKRAKLMNKNSLNLPVKPCYTEKFDEFSNIDSEESSHSNIPADNNNKIDEEIFKFCLEESTLCSKNSPKIEQQAVEQEIPSTSTESPVKNPKIEEISTHFDKLSTNVCRNAALYAAKIHKKCGNQDELKENGGDNEITSNNRRLSEISSEDSMEIDRKMSIINFGDQNMKESSSTMNEKLESDEKSTEIIENLQSIGKIKEDINKTKEIKENSSEINKSSSNNIENSSENFASLKIKSEFLKINQNQSQICEKSINLPTTNVSKIISCEKSINLPSNNTNQTEKIINLPTPNQNHIEKSSTNESNHVGSKEFMKNLTKIYFKGPNVDRSHENSLNLSEKSSNDITMNEENKDINEKLPNNNEIDQNITETINNSDKIEIKVKSQEKSSENESNLSIKAENREKSPQNTETSSINIENNDNKTTNNSEINKDLSLTQNSLEDTSKNDKITSGSLKMKFKFPGIDEKYPKIIESSLNSPKIKRKSPTYNEANEQPSKSSKTSKSTEKLIKNTDYIEKITNFAKIYQENSKNSHEVNDKPMSVRKMQRRFSSYHEVSEKSTKNYHRSVSGVETIKNVSKKSDNPEIKEDQNVDKEKSRKMQRRFSVFHDSSDKSSSSPKDVEKSSEKPLSIRKMQRRLTVYHDRSDRFRKNSKNHDIDVKIDDSTSGKESPTNNNEKTTINHQNKLNNHEPNTEPCKLNENPLNNLENPSNNHEIIESKQNTYEQTNNGDKSINTNAITDKKVLSEAEILENIEKSLRDMENGESSIKTTTEVTPQMIKTEINTQIDDEISNNNFCVKINTENIAEVYIKTETIENVSIKKENIEEESDNDDDIDNIFSNNPRLCAKIIKSSNKKKLPKKRTKPQKVPKINIKTEPDASTDANSYLTRSRKKSLERRFNDEPQTTTTDELEKQRDERERRQIQFQRQQHLNKLQKESKPSNDKPILANFLSPQSTLLEIIQNRQKPNQNEVPLTPESSTSPPTQSSPFSTTSLTQDDDHRQKIKSQISKIVTNELNVFYDLKKFQSDDPKNLFKSMARAITYHFHDKDPDTMPYVEEIKNYIFEIFYNKDVIRTSEDFLLKE